jgi:hypothetical protein
MIHTRLLTFPGGQWPPGGRLDTLHTEALGGRTDLLMDYQELEHITLPALFERDSIPWEQIQGIYRPHRLCFASAKIVEGAELCDYLSDLAPDDPARAMSSALAWRTPEAQSYYLFGIRTEAYPFLLLTAQRCIAQERAGPVQEVTLSRDWSPPPPSRARLVPNPTRLRQRYGGDPIAIRMNGRVYQRRLFIGGVDIQGEGRPEVDAVLNVGEEASRWAPSTSSPSTDRWQNKGEGSEGMTVPEIAGEAHWAIERLQAGQRVLVHCAAGMNRSATICCAVLILLEGLSAEAALERVREHHPWARPDSHHWLALRWLAFTSDASLGAMGACPGM